MPTSYVRDKIRIAPLTVEEARLISLLSTEERKALLLRAAEERAREALERVTKEKVS